MSILNNMWFGPSPVFSLLLQNRLKFWEVLWWLSLNMTWLQNAKKSDISSSFSNAEIGYTIGKREKNHSMSWLSFHCCFHGQVFNRSCVLVSGSEYRWYMSALDVLKVEFYPSVEWIKMAESNKILHLRPQQI